MNFSQKVISTIKPLLENQYHKLFFSSEQPMQDQIKKYQSKYFNNVVGCYHFFLSDSSIVSDYKQLIANRASVSTKYNFIYQNIKPYKLFYISSERDLQIAVQKEILFNDSYFQNNEISELLQDINEEALFENGFEGVCVEHQRKRIYRISIAKERLDDFLSNFTLVEGNAKRFKTGQSSVEYSLPEDVLSDLIDYSNESVSTLSKATVEWCQKNIQKPYSEITLYRGDGVYIDKIICQNFLSGSEAEFLNFKKWKEQDEHIEKLNYTYNDTTFTYIFKKWLSAYLSISNIKEFKEGNKVTINQSRNSSWSTSPQVAKDFFYSKNKDISLFLKATVPANFVAVDFNLLPKDIIQKHFKYFQNEVILINKPVPAKILSIKYSRGGQIWFNRHQEKI